MRELLKTVIALSVGGSVLAAALLAVRYFLRKRLPSTFFYYAWLVVLLRLILPLPGMMPVAPAAFESPGIAVSTNEAIPVQAANPAMLEVQAAPKVFSKPAPQYQLPRTLPTQPDLQMPEEKSAGWAWNWDAVLVTIWVLGILICLGRYGLCYASFVRSIRRLAVAAEPEDRELLRRLSPGRTPRLIRSRSVKTPMLVGTLHPVIVIPDRVYSEEMLSNILLHELTHFRRKDILYKWFAVTVYSIHWFNPLMLVIRRALDRDCEMSCDEFLLRRMDTANKRSYGETLLTLAEDRVLPGRLVATTFATEKKNLKERLEQIMTYRKMGKTALCLLLCAALVLCGCAASVGPAMGGTEPTLKEETEPTTMPEAAGDDAIHVTNVEEFLAAIGPDREIVLAPGEYNLTKAENYSRAGSDWYHWESCFDGYELVFDGLRNLTIRGENAAQTTICTEPRYANVLRFATGSGITLSDLTVGHTVEQGSCTGGVLYFDGCADVEVQNAKLYGCGIRGLELQNCQNVHMTNSDIYDCSYGCISIWGSYNVLLENNKYYDCHVYDAFEIFSSQEIAIINSEIYNIRGEEWGNSNLFHTNCTGIYLGGLDVHDNSVACLFECSAPVTVTSSRFQQGQSITNWLGSGYAPVSADGIELREGDLYNMSMRTVRWTPAPIIKTEAPAPSSDGKIHVTNADEFLASIGSDTTIFLEPGVYDLSKASNYGSLGGKNYYWQGEYDGPSLVINAVDNLTIEGAGADQVSIVAAPRYADVLIFEATSNLKLLNFTAGHSEAPGECSGGVLWFNYCTNTDIQGCSLYGCGILGVWAVNCTNLNVVDTEIYECSNGAVDFRSCTDVTLTGCNIHDNGACTYYADPNCKNVLIDGAELKGEVLFTEKELQSTVPSDARLPLVKAPAAGEDGKVHVTNVDEFLAAIASDTTIYLEPGVYDLSQAAGYGSWMTDYYHWQDEFDGPELVVSGVSNLTIEGAGKDQVSIVAAPRYANVLRFNATSHLKLLNFTAGHSEAPGECTGGVLRLEYCRNTEVQGCGLYGCGILGVSAEYCTNLDVVDTEIYDCSYGAVSFYSCKDVALTGCNVHDNGEPAYYADENCQNVLVDGHELRGGVSHEPRADVPAVQAPVAGEDGKVHVTNVDEFLAAIAPNTTIYLEPGVYDLSAAADYGSFGTDYYYWQDSFDGSELVINGASNLTIEGAGKEQVTIVAVPRFANVLRFTNLSGLILRGFTAGHSEAPGECSGGVIQLENVNNTNIEGCGLYGCGILGVSGFNCDTLYVTGTEIYDCSSGAAWFYDCQNVRVDYCDVHDIGGREFYADPSCQDVLIDGQPAPTDAPW